MIGVEIATPRRSTRWSRPCGRMPASIWRRSPPFRRPGGIRRWPGGSICTARWRWREAVLRHVPDCSLLYASVGRHLRAELPVGPAARRGGAAGADEHLRRDQGGGRPGAGCDGGRRAAGRCGCGRSTTPAPASPRRSWCRRSRARSHGSRPGCSRRCSSVGALDPQARFPRRARRVRGLSSLASTGARLPGERHRSSTSPPARRGGSATCWTSCCGWPAWRCGWRPIPRCCGRWTFRWLSAAPRWRGRRLGWTPKIAWAANARRRARGLDGARAEPLSG